MKRTDIAVIGAGPAGVGCAVQLKMLGFNPVVFERNRVGGLLHEASLLGNSFSGRAEKAGALISALKMKIRKFGIKLEKNRITDISYGARGFLLEKEHGGKTRCGILVIATGTYPENGGITAVPARENIVFYGIGKLRRVSGMSIAVIGGGDAAFDHSIVLGKNNKVSIFVRDKISASDHLVKEVLENRNISIFRGFCFKEMVKNGRGICLVFRGGDGLKECRADFLVLAVGRKPELSFIGPEFRRKMPYLKKNGLIFLAGDVKNRGFRMASIAWADGIKAAMEIAAAESGRDSR